MSRKQRIHDALFAELKPDTLIIEDESHRHHVPEGAESHFKVVAVSALFDKLNRISRHRLVNTVIGAEFNSGLHALTLHLYTPDEWQNTSNTPASPACRDGKRHV